MTADGFLIGPGEQPKVPGVWLSLWRPPAPPPGQTAECQPSAEDPEKHRETDVTFENVSSRVETNVHQPKSNTQKQNK